MSAGWLRSVNNHEIVVGRRVEGHADVFRCEELLFVGIVARHEDVVSANAFFAFGGIVHGDTIGEKERIVMVVCFTSAEFFQLMFHLPFSADERFLFELQLSCLVGFGIEHPVAKFVEEKCAVGVLSVVEEIYTTHDGSAFF